MKQKKNWWLDLVLFITFIATFFLDRTGVEMHQWLGVTSGVLALYHLIFHWDWVVAVSKRFFSRLSNKTGYFFLIDAALLMGFVLILFTGLVISTWFNLILGDYSAWLRLHIIVSIGTLSLVALKLALHWRWIARTARKIWSQPAFPPQRILAKQPKPVSASCLDRRGFLKVMSVVGIASSVALLHAYKSLADVGDTILETDPAGASSSEASTSFARSSNFTDSRKSSGFNVSSSSSSTTENEGCTVRCGRHCSYPGRCRRYVDSNQNNLCDLGECM